MMPFSPFGFAWLFSMLLLSSFSVEGREDIRVEKQFFSKVVQNSNYELNISYPKINYPASEINHTVNLDIQRIMALAIADFTQKVKGSEQAGGFSSLTLDYKIHFHHADILSVKFIKHTVYAGQEQPVHLFLTYNYDLKQGKPLALADLFMEPEGYQEELVKIIQQSVRKCKFKTDRVLKNFCLGMEGLVLNFDDLNSSKNCEEEVLISWSEFSSLLRDDGVGSIFKN